MCRWMGSHFHNSIDYNGVAFSIELLEWGRTFSEFLEEENSDKWDLKMGRFAVKNCPKVTKMGFIIGHRIEYNGV